MKQDMENCLELHGGIDFKFHITPFSRHADSGKSETQIQGKAKLGKFRHSRLLTCLYNFLELCLHGPIKILNKWLSFQLSNNEKIVPYG